MGWREIKIERGRKTEEYGDKEKCKGLREIVREREGAKERERKRERKRMREK